MGIAITEDHRELASVVRSFPLARKARSPARELLDSDIERAVTPGPFVPTVIASATIAACGSHEQQARLPPRLVAGSAAAGIGLATDPEASDTAICGQAGVVPGAALAATWSSSTPPNQV